MPASCVLASSNPYPTEYMETASANREKALVSFEVVCLDEWTDRKRLKQPDKKSIIVIALNSIIR